MIASNDARTVVKYFEGLGDGDKHAPNLQVYICPAGVATNGYGNVLHHPVTGKQLRVSIYGRSEALRLAALAVKKKYGRDWITEAEADADLEANLTKFSAEVTRLLKGAATTQKQFDALTSLAFNIGTGNLSTSTVLKRHIARNNVKMGTDMKSLSLYSRQQKIVNMDSAFCAWSFSNGEWLAGLFKRRWVEMELYFGADVKKSLLIAETFKR